MSIVDSQPVTTSVTVVESGRQGGVSAWLFIGAAIFLATEIAVFAFAFASGWNPSALSRDAAGQKVADSYWFKTERNMQITIGPLPSYEAIEADEKYSPLRQAGFLKIWRTQTGKTIELLPAGQAALKSLGVKEQSGTIFVPLATREFKNVMGISTRDNIAEVQFSWRWKMNEIGRLFATDDFTGEITAKGGTIVLSTQDHYNAALFKKWDDGWRVDSTDLK